MCLTKWSASAAISASAFVALRPAHAAAALAKLGVDERQSAERRNLLGVKHCPARRPKGVAHVVVPVSPARLTPIGLPCSVTLGDDDDLGLP